MAHPSGGHPQALRLAPPTLAAPGLSPPKPTVDDQNYRHKCIYMVGAACACMSFQGWVEVEVL